MSKDKYYNRLESLFTEIEAVAPELSASPAVAAANQELQALRARVVELEAALAQTAGAAAADVAPSQVLAALTDLIFVYNDEGRYLEIIPTDPTLLYRPADDLLGHTMHELMPPAKADELLGQIRRALAESRTVRFEYSLLIGGDELWFEGTAAPRTADTVFWVARDITERKRAEAALQVSEAQYRSFVDSTQDLVQSVAPDGQFLFVNQAWLATLGYSADEAAGLDFFRVIHPDYLPQCEATFARIADGETLDHVEYVFVSKAGARVLVEGRSVPRWQDGKVVATLSHLRDVTGQRDQQALIAKRAAELATVAEISTAATSITDAGQLLQAVVDLTRDRFNLYHAHIYLLNDAGDTLVLSAGAGAIGRQMTAEGRRIPLAQEQSLVARAGRNREGVIVNDVRSDPAFLPHPLLPATRAELAVPLIAGDQLLGVFDVQADTVERFTREDVNIQTALASQVAAALQNARSLERSEKAVFELNLLARRLTREGWEDYLRSLVQNEQGFQYDLERVRPVTNDRALPGPAESVLTQTLTIQGEPIGQLALAEPQAHTEDVAEIMDAVAERLSAHLENLRLGEAAQKRAAEMEAVNRVGAATATILEADRLLQEVVDLATASFNLYHAHVYLLDEAGVALKLKAGAGEIGRRMVEAERVIPIEMERSVVVQAALQREPIIVNDVSQEPNFLPNPLLPATRAELAIPMFVGDQLLGVFDVQSDQVGFFSEEEVRIQETLAQQVAVALQNANLYAEQTATVARLQELDNLKSSFLANMSHELRTPLNSILGFTDVILEGLDGPLTDRMENDLKIVQKNGKHLLELINDVLDMAKIEAGRMTLSIEPFILDDLLEEVLEMAGGLAHEKAIEVRLDLDPANRLQIEADRVRLRQIMFNLVSNAIKYTDEGSVTVRVATEGENCRIAVVDTGLGIPKEKHLSIFEAFSQVDNSTTRKVGGTGLDLPITRHLVELHGGRLWVESDGTPGSGTTFMTELPIESKYKVRADEIEI